MKAHSDGWVERGRTGPEQRQGGQLGGLCRNPGKDGLRKTVVGKRREKGMDSTATQEVKSARLVD